MKHLDLFRGLLLALALTGATIVANANLTNGGFDTPYAGYTGPNYLASNTAFASSSPSSADQWNLWNNTANSTTTTELLASTDPLGSGNMIHINTDGAGDGIFQLNSLFATASIDVYVLRGVAHFALFQGNSFSSVDSTTTGAWETLTLSTGLSPNEIVLYSGPTGGADFYADRASNPAAAPITSSVPDGGTTAVMLGTAVFGLACLRRKL